MKNEKKIVEIFEKRYQKIPSILHIRNEKISKDSLEKFLSKSHLIFVNKIVTDGKILETEKLVEYDSTGIFIYIESGLDIFILSASDRLGVAEFTLHNLIKLNK
jgi:hypothetical protein